MTTTESPTLDQVLTLVQRLSASDKLRLIARVAPQLVAALEETGDDPWDELLRLGDETAHLPPLAEDSADVLSAMRR